MPRHTTALETTAMLPDRRASRFAHAAIVFALVSSPNVALFARADASAGQITASGDAAARRGGEEVSFAIEHSLDGSTFIPTGVISGKLAVDRNDGRNFRLSAARAMRTPLDAESAAALNALIESDGIYRVRVPANIVSAREGSHVMASLPARCVAAANLADALTLHADDRGNAYGVEYATASGECDVNSDNVVKVKPGMNFRTTVSVRVPKDAPGLNPNAPTDLRFGGPLSERAQKEKARSSNSKLADGHAVAKPPQTFMQKHWMKLLMGFYAFAFLCAPPPPPQKTKKKTQ